MTATTTERTTIPALSSTGDPARSAHIVLVPPHLKPAFPSPQAYVLAARINGTPIEALCGFTWVPSQNPENLPVCTRCVEIYQQPGEHRDTRDELPEA